MNTGEQSPSGNGKTQVLSALLTGDNSMKLITVILIVISGGANFLGTKEVSANVNLERDKAVAQIHELYARVDDFEERQKLVLQGMKDLAESNGAQLKNQTRLLEKADAELTQLAAIMKRLDEERARKNDTPDNL